MAKKNNDKYSDLFGIEVKPNTEDSVIHSIVDIKDNKINSDKTIFLYPVGSNEKPNEFTISEQQLDLLSKGENAIVLFDNEGELNEIQIIKYIEPEIEKPDNSNMKYFIVNTETNKIKSGFEFKEDATKQLRGLPNSDEYKTASSRDLKLDPNDQQNWESPVENNKALIDSAIEYFKFIASENNNKFIPISTKEHLELKKKLSQPNNEIIADSELLYTILYAYLMKLIHSLKHAAINGQYKTMYELTKLINQTTSLISGK